MRIKVFTIFPDMLRPMLQESILGRAIAAGHIAVELIDIRAYAENKHKKTDDYPFGGGAGMVMLAQPIVSAFEAHTAPDFSGRRIYMSPRGRRLDQQIVEELSQCGELMILCGHYEGVDQRVIDRYIDMEISIGDYVVTGGELPAMVLIDCICRLKEGVLGSEDSPEEESFTDDALLEYPHYTRPREFEGMEVPEVLLSGHHAQIAAWRRQQRLLITAKQRPDLLKRARISQAELEWLNEQGITLSDQ